MDNNILKTNSLFFKEKIKSPPIDRAGLIVSKCRDKKVLDLGCVQHSFKHAKNNQDWLHKKISDVASYILGIDYLENDVKKLKEIGYNVIQGDVTKPLNISTKFDVIVAGNLIEHLVNFEGFFNNLKNWLAPNGEILISTANPFYIDQFFYSAFKKSIVINPEHTCWIDLVALNQLASRFGFSTAEIYFIKEAWKLGYLILEDEYQTYDMLEDRWIRLHGKISSLRRFIRKIIVILYFLYCKITGRNFYKYKKLDREDLVERVAINKMFQFFWFFYKLFIKKSFLNKHELYISILKQSEYEN